LQSMHMHAPQDFLKDNACQGGREGLVFGDIRAERSQLCLGHSLIN